MQLVVLGMHRSGTSGVTRLLNLAGAYFGPEGIATDANDENPKGFWERRDVRAVCDGLLQGAGFDWWQISEFTVERIADDVRRTNLGELQRILYDLDAHRPWVLKEPRLCLLFPLIEPYLEAPVCVHVTREPLEVAESLHARNGLPVQVGLALWEAYTLHAVAASEDVPRVHVRYEELLADPLDTVRRLVGDLTALGVAGLRVPSDREVAAFVNAKLHRQRRPATARAARLTGQQAALAAATDEGRIFDGWEMAELSEAARDTLATYEAARDRVEELETLAEELEQQVATEVAARDAEIDARTRALEERLGEQAEELETVRAAHHGSVELAAQRERRVAELECELEREMAATVETVERYEARLSAAEAEVAAERRDALQRAEAGRALDTSLQELERKARALGDSTTWRVARRSMALRQVVTPGLSRPERDPVERLLGGIQRARHQIAALANADESPTATDDTVRTEDAGTRVGAVAGSSASGGHDLDVSKGAHASGSSARTRGAGAPSSSRPTIAVVAWDAGHNPLGRAYILADLLRRRFDVELWGAQFERYGTRVWAPLRDAEIPVRTFPGASFPEHLAIMDEVASGIEADAVWVSKPRLPSYALGILAKERRNRPLVLDVDDHELSFFSEDQGIDPREFERRRGELDLSVPFEAAWTRACDWAVSGADQVTVSNPVLQDRYGGVVVPHARDERVFDPERYDRDEVRRRIGVESDTRLLLFGGTPRIHKGVVEVLEALERLGDDRYRVALFGTHELDELRPRIGDLERWVIALPYQPFATVAPLVGAADLACVLQDPQHRISRYQMPAKLTDALAMEVPCLVRAVPPVAALVDEGVVHVAGREPLHERIAAIFDDHDDAIERARRGRKLFLEQYSYAAVCDAIAPEFERLLDATPPLGAAARTLIEVPRRLFGDAGASGTVRPPAARMPGRRKRPIVRGEPYDLVMFWKQNDTSIYGRRQDMFLKYLERSGRFHTIVHFDNPITPEALIETYRTSTGGTDQRRLVVRQTVQRLLHRSDRGRTHFHTFLHAGRRSHRLRLRPRSEYVDYVRSVLERRGVGRRPTVFWVYPTNEDFPAIADAIDPDLVVADVVDDNRSWYEEGDPRWDRLDRNYEEILSRSDIVLANCEPVARSMQRFASEVHVIPNACERPDLDAVPARPRELTRLRGPVIGYVGNLSSRIDIPLLDAIARARPNWNLVFIGSAHLDQSILDLDVHPNVHFLGVKPYAETQRFVAHFDVALIPHVDNEMTRSMNPLKAFVYYAAGVPVVATPVANMDDLADAIAIADDADAFVAAIEEALTNGRRTPDPDMVSRHAWDVRVDCALQLVDEALGVAAIGAGREAPVGPAVLDGEAR